MTLAHILKILQQMEANFRHFRKSQPANTRKPSQELRRPGEELAGLFGAVGAASKASPRVGSSADLGATSELRVLIQKQKHIRPIFC